MLLRPRRALATSLLLWIALACETEGDRPADTIIGTGLPGDTGRATARQPGGATTARTGGSVVRAELTGDAIRLATDTIPAGETRFVLVNESAYRYTVDLLGQGTAMKVDPLPSGALQMLMADLRPGSYTLRLSREGVGVVSEAHIIVR